MKSDYDKKILIADYGRSGQGWLSYMLCYILNAKYVEPYCLMRGLIYTGNEKVLELTNGNLPGRKNTEYSMVVKTHELPDPYFSLTDKVVILSRDPRDVACSAHARYSVQSKTGTDVEKKAQGMAMCSNKQVNNLKRLKPSVRLIKEYILSFKWVSYYITARRWGRFYSTWENVSFSHRVSYEGLSENPKAVLSGILKYLGHEADERLLDEAVEKFRFEVLSGREKGKEEKDNVAFRKGISGDYRDKMNRAHMMLFRHACGNTAKRWGYDL